MKKQNTRDRKITATALRRKTLKLNPKQTLEDIERNVDYAYDKGYKDGTRKTIEHIIRILKCLK